MTYLIISCIDENFVHNLIETRDVFNVSIDHPVTFRVKSPHSLSYHFYTSNIRIGSFEDMLDRGKLKQELVHIIQSIVSLVPVDTVPKLIYSFLVEQWVH